jgi:hypothetical protein
MTILAMFFVQGTRRSALQVVEKEQRTYLLEQFLLELASIDL